MKNSSLFLMFLALFTVQLNLSAQHTVQYNALRCSGTIPNDFLKLSTDKVINEQRKINSKKISKKEKALEKEFALNSNFGIDDILFSGKVLYGDPLSNYINKVADKVLKDQPKLRSELRFYVLKSYSVNAFSTNQGIIFVTVGFLSQIENEAQLAYVLCHEISQYTKKHTLESFKKKNDVIKGKGKFKSLDFDEKIEQLYNYSKENEFEADKEGLKLYLEAGYSAKAALSSFDMLLYSYLPYDEIDWGKQLLEDSLYKFPVSYTPKKSKEISADEAEDDEKSTHPNVRKRRANVEDLLQIENNKSNVNEFLGNDYFKAIQQQARIELFYILFNHAQYKKAYYLAFLYQNIYKDNAFASKIAAYSIYAKSLKKNKSDKNSLGEEFSDNAEGAFYNVTYFFNKLNEEELHVLTVRETWKALQLNPNDDFCQQLFDQACQNLFSETDLKFSFFRDKLDSAKSTVSLNDTNINIDGLSKVEKLKLKQKIQEQTDNEDNAIIASTTNKDYAKWGFFEQLKNESFRKTLKSASIFIAEGKSAEEEEKNKDINENKIRRWRKRNGILGGIDSMILVSPNFTKVTISSSAKQDLMFNESEEIKLGKLYEDMAKNNEITAFPLNIADKKNLNTTTLNHFTILMEWLTERMNNTAPKLVLFNSKETQATAKTIGTSKVFISGINYTIEKNEFNGVTLVYSLILYPTLPFYLYDQFKKIYRLNLSSVVFDVETSKILYSSNNTYRFKYNRKDYLNNQIYALFNQIKTKPVHE